MTMPMQSIPIDESDDAWWKRLDDEAYAAGAHFVHSWLVEYDSGDDGCVPKGWYAQGLDATGYPITSPMRHEYGPYDTEQEALGVIDEYNSRLAAPDLPQDTLDALVRSGAPRVTTRRTQG